MQLNIAVCDDEPIICEGIRKKILEIKTDYQVDIYNTGAEIVSADKRYDLIFLDIEMPGKDGMIIAKELREKGYKGNIVFLTSHTEFMPEAFKVRAFRFLEKPVKTGELEETLSEAEKEFVNNKKLIVADSGAHIIINISDILYVEGKKNDTIIHMTDGSIETKKTMKYWLTELGEGQFCQVHKSYLVSLRYIKEVYTDRVTMQYIDDEIPVSRRNATLVKKVFFDYIKSNAKPI